MKKVSVLLLFAIIINTFSGLTAVADGFGPASDYSFSVNNHNKITILSYNGAGGDVVIPSEINGLEVEIIGERAFYLNQSITSLVIPGTVKEIKDFAFMNCRNLKKITLSSGLETIGVKAFHGCGITDLILPDTIIEIKNGAFMYCKQLNTVTIPNSIKNLEERVFMFCSSLEKANIPWNISLSTSLFANCFNLKSEGLIDDDHERIYTKTTFYRCYSIDDWEELCSITENRPPDEFLSWTAFEAKDGIIYVPDNYEFDYYRPSFDYMPYEVVVVPDTCTFKTRCDTLARLNNVTFFTNRGSEVAERLIRYHAPAVMYLEDYDPVEWYKGILEERAKAEQVSFDDVKEYWDSYSAIEYVVKNGYMSGTSETTFSPNTELNRAMLVTILSAISDINKSEYIKKVFDDVSPDAYYGAAVAWAYENGIVGGTGGGKFSPEAPLTNEAAAVILHKFAEFMGYNVYGSGYLKFYSDADEVSSWAYDSVSKLVYHGILTPTDRKLEPKKTVTRIKTAEMIMNLCENLSKEDTSGLATAAKEAVYGDEAEAYDLDFTDVPADSWFFEAVNYAYHNGITGGTGDNSFSPDVSLTRGMYVTMLAKIDGAELEKYAGKNTFTDVASGTWYHNAVEWAYENGIVSGTGSGIFSPNTPVDREQIALMIYKYSQYKGNNISVTNNNLSGFSDASKISTWAKDAMNYAVEVGLISGVGGNMIFPKSGATRAQSIQILYRYIQKYLLEYTSAIELSNAFSDNMIIQRGEKITIWGTLKDYENKAINNQGKLIYANLGGKAAGYGTIDKEGRWEVVLDRTLPASNEKIDLTVSSGENTITVKDIMIGDVYMIIGQSNVYYSTNNYLWTWGEDVYKLAYEQYFADFDLYDIRLFRNSSEDYKFYKDFLHKEGYVGQTAYEDVYQTRGWQKPSDVAKNVDDTYYYYKQYGITPSVAEIFSAMGYYTACEIYKNTGVPTGMIEIDGSGYSIGSFMPNELCEENNIDQKDSNKRTMVDKATGMSTRFVYNQQIHPIRKFSYAGLIWYQGESDGNNTEAKLGKDAYTFADRLTDLLNYFRDHFGNNDFPVFLVEFPMCSDYNSMFYIDTGVVRGELNTVKAAVKDTYILASSDLYSDYSHGDSVHAFCKPQMAVRLGKMIATAVYGDGKDFSLSAGPTLTDIEYNGSSAVLTFDNVGTGLKFEGDKYSGGLFLMYAGEYDSSNGKMNMSQAQPAYAPRNFVEVKDDNAVEIIAPNKIRVTGTEDILGVGYNIVGEYCFPNSCGICNSYNVPAAAFVEYK